jgi:hypothetical protein
MVYEKVSERFWVVTYAPFSDMRFGDGATYRLKSCSSNFSLSKIIANSIMEIQLWKNLHCSLNLSSPK